MQSVILSLTYLIVFKASVGARGAHERDRERDRQGEDRNWLVTAHLHKTVHLSHADKFITHLSYLATASLYRI